MIIQRLKDSLEVSRRLQKIILKFTRLYILIDMFASIPFFGLVHRKYLNLVFREEVEE